MYYNLFKIIYYSFKYFSYGIFYKQLGIKYFNLINVLMVFKYFLVERMSLIQFREQNQVDVLKIVRIFGNLGLIFLNKSFFLFILEFVFFFYFVEILLIIFCSVIFIYILIVNYVSGQCFL